MSSPVLDKAMTEDELLQAVGEALTLGHWRWTHQRRSDKALTMGHRGLPDIVAVKGRRVLFIELKSEAGRLSVDQRLWMADLAGAAYWNSGEPETWLVKPSTLDVFLGAIR